MPNNRRLTLVLALGALLLIGTGCSRGPSPTTTATPTGVPVNEPASVTVDDTPTGVTTDDTPTGVPVNEPARVATDDTPTDVSTGDTPADFSDEPARQRTIKVTAKDFSFEPAEIRVAQGEKIRLEVTSVDVDHGIAIPAFNLNAALKPNTMAVLEFTADKKGSFPFFCSVFCGSGHGSMRGTLVVE